MKRNPPWGLSARRSSCGDRYAAVTARHQTFSVLSVFRVNPLTMDALLTQSLRDETVRMLDAHANTASSIACVMQASPLIAAAMHMSAAAVARLTRANRALRITSAFEEGLAHVAAVPAAVPEATLRAHGAAGVRRVDHGASRTVGPRGRRGRGSADISRKCNDPLHCML